MAYCKQLISQINTMATGNKKIDLINGKHVTNRMPNKAIDPYYIDAYLDNPKAGKRKALETAYKVAGVDKDATRQRAYDLHDRLRDQIERRLVKLAADYKAIGLSKLVELCKSAEAESVQLAAAKTLTTELFPNVTIERIETIEDIDAELAELESEIAQTNPVRLQ